MTAPANEGTEHVHVPETPSAPTGEPRHDPASPATDDSLRHTVEKLQEAVDGLTLKVESLAPLPGDDVPTSRPWTHRRFD